MYRTDKGSLDKGGLPQPSFLNFDAKLLYPPAHALQVRPAWLYSAKGLTRTFTILPSPSPMWQRIYGLSEAQIRVLLY